MLVPDRNFVVNRDGMPPESVAGTWFHVFGFESDDTPLDAYVLGTLDEQERLLIREVRIIRDRVLPDHLHGIPLGHLTRVITKVFLGEKGELDAPPELLRRTRGEDSAEFAQKVAQHYRYWSSRTEAPAKAISSESGVPVGTVHRWIREARAAGALPPGQQGRVG